jgi:hypothetical protein
MSGHDKAERQRRAHEHEGGTARKRDGNALEQSGAPTSTRGDRSTLYIIAF